MFKDMVRPMELHRLEPVLELAPRRFDGATEVIGALAGGGHFGKVYMRAWEAGASSSRAAPRRAVTRSRSLRPGRAQGMLPNTPLQFDQPKLKRLVALTWRLSVEESTYDGARAVPPSEPQAAQHHEDRSAIRSACRLPGLRPFKCENPLHLRDVPHLA